MYFQTYNSSLRRGTGMIEIPTKLVVSPYLPPQEQFKVSFTVTYNVTYYAGHNTLIISEKQEALTAAGWIEGFFGTSFMRKVRSTNR